MEGRLYSNHIPGTAYTVIKMDAESKQSEAFDIGAAKNSTVVATALSGGDDTYLYVAFKE